MKQDWQSILTAYVRNQGGRLTIQRFRVAQVFMDITKHLTIGEIEERVLRLYPHIGRATIYRTIKLLVDAGLAVASDFGDGVRRYEPRIKNDLHFHLICKNCGELMEIEATDIVKTGFHIARGHGFLPTSIRMEVVGLCPGCQKEEA